MNDLFRFLMLRPANATTPDDAIVLTPTYADAGTTREMAIETVGVRVRRKELPVRYADLSFTDVADAIVDLLRTGPVATSVVEQRVNNLTGETCADLVATTEFQRSEEAVADSLVAMKLLSSSSGEDAPAFATAAQGYDAIRMASTGRDPISLRILVMPDFAPSAPRHRDEHPTRLDRPPVPGDTSLARAFDQTRVAVRAVDQAIAFLGRLPASAFATSNAQTDANTLSRVAAIESRLAALEPAAGERPILLGDAGAATSRPWMLSPETISALPRTVIDLLAKAGVDPLAQPLPVLLNALEHHKTQILADWTDQVAADVTMMHHGAALIPPQADFVGIPDRSMPTGHGNIRPVGVGDLLVVKQHLLRYEGGDLAHVENVLKTESITRETRRLDRTETTIFHETETTKEEQRDVQSTDRFSLQREASDTVKSESEFKAGISVDAKYGPFIEVKANADYATKSSSESATKQATEFSKDVVTRSASKLVERVLDRRTTTTINEFEEKYSHGFDNTDGTGHISGYYQWIDKVLQAQVYNYGKRLLFDVTLPEPGTNYIVAMNRASQEDQSLLKEPEPFTATADQIDSLTYTVFAKKYDATGLEPPPLEWKIFSKAYDRLESTSPHDSSKSDMIQIEEGYSPQLAYIVQGGMQAKATTPDAPTFEIIVGSNIVDLAKPFSDIKVGLNDETGGVPVAFYAHMYTQYAITIEVLSLLNVRGREAWKLKTHAALSQAYQAKKLQYEQQLAQAKTEAGVVIAGRNPMFNKRLMTTELRRQCLELVTNQHFDAFGALRTGAHNTVEPNVAAAETQMPYVRFFEQAFEWEHIVYFFYPYFWGLKKAWKYRQLLDDVDAVFADFLRAGAARVVFPVRRGFEEAVVHYVETGQIWNGGPPPELADTNLYVPIIKEIQEASGAPGDEKPVGEPWFVHLPTTLVRLRPNDDLPRWKKVGEDWEPAN